MRIYETAIIVLLFVIWAINLLPRQKLPRWLYVYPSTSGAHNDQLSLPILPILAGGAVLAQLTEEGYRWPMIPAYALVVLINVRVLLPLFRRAKTPTNVPKRIGRIGWMVLWLVALVIAAALPIELPMFQLPTPTGTYKVGTTTLELVDQSRPEVYPPNTTAHRDLMVHVWYPANPANGAKPQPYWTDVNGPYWAANLNLPSFTFDYVNSIQTHSYKDAPVADALLKYPVIIFSHGTGSSVSQSTAQMEELASHGYIVFGIDHPYQATAIFYPDGRVIPSSPGQSGFFPNDPQEEIITTHEKCSNTSDPVAAEVCWKHFIDLSPNTQNSLKVWTQDTRFVLDELERLNSGTQSSLFAGRLDLGRIGLFGHSFGGATAGEVCLLDSRCKAGVNMDGFQYGDLLDGAVKQPFMVMYSIDNVGSDDFMYNKVENQAYRVFIKGSRHQNFTDASLELGAPVGEMVGFVGSIDGQRMETIVSRYLVAFFDKHLMGISSPVLDAPDPAYPEVDFQSRSGK